MTKFGADVNFNFPVTHTCMIIRGELTKLKSDLEQLNSNFTFIEHGSYIKCTSGIEVLAIIHRANYIEINVSCSESIIREFISVLKLKDFSYYSYGDLDDMKPFMRPFSHKSAPPNYLYINCIPRITYNCGVRGEGCLRLSMDEIRNLLLVANDALEIQKGIEILYIYEYENNQSDNDDIERVLVIIEPKVLIINYRIMNEVFNHIITDYTFPISKYIDITRKDNVVEFISYYFDIRTKNKSANSKY